MPAPALKTMAEKHGISLSKAEELWEKAKGIAEDRGFEEGTDDFYAYTMGVLKKMFGETSNSSSILSEIASGLASKARGKSLETAEINTDAVEALPFDEQEGRQVARRLEVESWLPLAASTYQISPHIEDYIIVPHLIVPSDVPNRNNVGFIKEELMAFNHHRGMPAFKTWRGMPTHLEHQNSDHTKAKGIVLDTYIKAFPEAEGDMLKVMALSAFDGSKDPALYTQIRNKIRRYYSMGAFINQYECAICGAVSKKNNKNTDCGHVVRGKIKFFDVKTQEWGTIAKPSYYIARGITGFEISSVAVPAWAGAENTLIFGD